MSGRAAAWADFSTPTWAYSLFAMLWNKRSLTNASSDSAQLRVAITPKLVECTGMAMISGIITWLNAGEKWARRPRMQLGRPSTGTQRPG